MRAMLIIPTVAILMAGCVEGRDEKEVMYRPANGACPEDENWGHPTAMRDNMVALSKRMAETPDHTKKHLDDAVKIIMCIESAKRSR